MNPKKQRAIEANKVPFEYLIYSVLENDAWVHKGGADNYGHRNWLIDEIEASTYQGAMFRHLKAWAEGEDIDPKSGRPHLSHLRANCAVVMDAQEHGMLIDDRNRKESKGEQNDQDNIRSSDIGRSRYTLSENVERARNRLREDTTERGLEFRRDTADSYQHFPVDEFRFRD